MRRLVVYVVELEAITEEPKIVVGALDIGRVGCSRLASSRGIKARSISSSISNSRASSIIENNIVFSYSAAIKA